jgi:hypothetical protein
MTIFYYYTTFSVSSLYSFEWQDVRKWETEKDLEENRLGLMEVISRDLRRGAKNLSHEASVPTGIRTELHSNLSLGSYSYATCSVCRVYIGILIHLQTRINVENAILSVISGFVWKIIKILNVML